MGNKIPTSRVIRRGKGDEKGDMDNPQERQKAEKEQFRRQLRIRSLPPPSLRPHSGVIRGYVRLRDLPKERGPRLQRTARNSFATTVLR